MAEAAEYGLTEGDVKLFRWMAQQLRSGQFNGEQNGQRRPPWGVYRAKAIGSHAPDAVQAVQLCDSSWTAISGETPDAKNEGLVTVPDGIRMYCIPGGDESLLILQAFICEDA